MRKIRSILLWGNYQNYKNWIVCQWRETWSSPVMERRIPQVPMWMIIRQGSMRRMVRMRTRIMTQLFTVTTNKTSKIKMTECLELMIRRTRKSRSKLSWSVRSSRVRRIWMGMRVSRRTSWGKNSWDSKKLSGIFFRVRVKARTQMTTSTLE